MKPSEAIRALATRAPISDRAISQKLGKSPGWIYNTIRNGGSPRLDTVASVADIADIDVCLVDRATGETIATIDPPAHQGSPGDH